MQGTALDCYTWYLGISRENGMLSFYLHCNKEISMHRKWSIRTKYTMKLVAASGKDFQRTRNYEFQKPRYGVDELISWENMQRDYVNDDSILIEAHANIINMRDTPTWQPNIGKSFVLKHTFGNISRFLPNEQDYSDIEEHYNIRWRIIISKTLDERLGIYLFCKKAVCEGKKYEVKCELEVQLISSSGKCDAGRRSVVFDQPYGRGMTLISWEKMKKYYVDNDSINVEVIVNIIDIKESSCIMSNTGKKFVLSFAVENISSIKEGNYSTGIENRFNIPWKLQIQRQGGFVVLSLNCAKGQNEFPKWSVETKIQLKVVSTNGNNISCPVCYMFNNEEKCISWGEFLTWRYMENKLVVNDRVIIEAHVEILSITGIEDEKPAEKPSGIVIPVGNKNYSMEEWMKMAFDQ